MFIDIQKVLFNGAGLPTEWYVSPSTVRLLGCEESFLWRDPLESLLQASLSLFPLSPPSRSPSLSPRPPPPLSHRPSPRARSLSVHTCIHPRGRETLWRGGQVWPLLLARAAGDSSVPDSVLLQMIKDASDHVERLDWDLSQICGSMELLDALRSLVLYFSPCCSRTSSRVPMDTSGMLLWRLHLFPPFHHLKNTSTLFLTLSILRPAYSTLTCSCTKRHVLCHLCTAGWATSA